MINFKSYLSEEIEVGQAMDAHEPTQRGSTSISNPIMETQVNLHLFTELNDVFLTPHAGFQKIRKVLHTFGLDIPALYDIDPEGDELVMEVDQFGDPNFGNALLYVLYYLKEEGYFEFYAEITDEDGVEELLSSGLEESEEE
jgi:hypothetical protein